MNAIKSSIAAVVWLMAKAACAQAAALEWSGGDSDAGASTPSADSGSISTLAFTEDENNRQAPRRDTLYADYLSVYRLTQIGGVFAATGFQSLSTSAAAASFIQQQTGIDTRAMLSPDHWLNSGNGIAHSVAVGHAWRDLTLEGTAFSSRDDQQMHGRREIRRLDSRSARLSFSPAANWVVRLSRGTVSGLDHLVAGEEVRRTAVSATYRRGFADGDWEATLAWGRNARKFREATVGYLVESAYRFSGVHSVFGRLEQVGSDEIVRENESLQRQLFMMNKLTIGYSQDMRLTSSLRMDAGAYVSRHFVPSTMAPSYGSGPTAYMMFVRLKLQ